MRADREPELRDARTLRPQSAVVVGAHIKRHYGKPIVLGGNNLDYLMQFHDAFHSWWQAVITHFDAAVTDWERRRGFERL